MVVVSSCLIIRVLEASDSDGVSVIVVRVDIPAPTVKLQRLGMMTIRIAIPRPFFWLEVSFI
jgi:hypothetical protein